MSIVLEDFVTAHPSATLSHTTYGQHFHLGYGVNILSSPTQRLQFFVENGTEGTPYRFLIVGRLTSFKVVQDAVGHLFFFYPLKKGAIFTRCPKFGHYLSVCLGDLQTSSFFTDLYWGQMGTLKKIEEEDGKDPNVHAQVCRPSS